MQPCNLMVVMAMPSEPVVTCGGPVLLVTVCEYVQYSREKKCIECVTHRTDVLVLHWRDVIVK